MSVISILLVLIIILTLVYVYQLLNPATINPEVIKLQQKPQLSISTTQFQVPTSLNYYYEGWLRVDTVPDMTKQYVIFNRGNDFIVVLKGHELSIVYSGRGTNGTPTPADIDANTGILPNAPSGTQHVNILTVARNFPFQKWTYFCFSVEGNTLDAYLDGKLVSSMSKPIENPNSAGSTISLTSFNNSSPITVGNATTEGGISRFRRIPESVNPQIVWNHYMMGPGNTLDYNFTGAYHAKVGITQHGNELKSVVLF